LSLLTQNLIIMPSTPKVSVYIATSLDGFIARPDGDIDWLTRPEDRIEGEDFGYKAFMDTVDVLVMGRNTYEKVLSFGGEWPYAGKHMVVLSSGNPIVPDALTKEVEVRQMTPAEVLQYLGERGFQHIYLDGGKTIQAFLREGLVQEMTLTRIPVLIGQGIPLFGETGHDIVLKHLETIPFVNGFVQSKYAVQPA
jgi:dihydrofolate reductase